MNVKELRVGNYIGGLNDLKQVSVVCAISENDIGYERLSDSEYFQGNSFIPIPLTEEWLLKFGFEKDYKEYLKKKLVLSYIDEKLVKVINTYYADSIEIKYVNQLQNLYFALTGKELEIKE